MDVDRGLTATCVVTVIDETDAIPLHVTLNKAMAIIQVGVTEQLIATLVPPVDIYVPLTWSSSNPAVAAVSATGLVTGISAGTAAITVSMENGINATCIFNVSEVDPLPSYVLLNKITANIKTGNTEKLVATTSPADRPLTWSSSNPAVATVNDSGLVTGISIGTAKITASIEGGIPMACMVAVSDSGDNEHSSGGGGCEALNFGVLGFALLLAFITKRKRIS